MNLIWFLIIGGLAGWLAGLIMKGKGFGVLANIGIGIVGSFIGGFLFGLLQLSAHGAIGRLVTATVGAVLLLVLSLRRDEILLPRWVGETPPDLLLSGMMAILLFQVTGYSLAWAWWWLGRR